MVVVLLAIKLAASKKKKKKRIFSLLCGAHYCEGPTLISQGRYKI